MEAVATRAADNGERFIAPSALRAIEPRRGERLRRLLCAALDAMNAAPRDVPPEFFRYPFP